MGALLSDGGGNIAQQHVRETEAHLLASQSCGSERLRSRARHAGSEEHAGWRRGDISLEPYFAAQFERVVAPNLGYVRVVSGTLRMGIGVGLRVAQLLQTAQSGRRKRWNQRSRGCETMMVGKL